MKTHVMNKDTFTNKIATGLGYLGLGIATFAGLNYLSDRREDVKFEDNAEEVQALVEQKKFDDAVKLASDYHNAGFLREQDYISISNLIEREGKKYSNLEGTFRTMNESIQQRKINEAWTALKQLDEIGALGVTEKDSIGRLLYKISDQYLLDKYSEGDPKQKLEIGEEYIKFYPEGKDAFAIANYIIGRRADVLVNDMMFGEKASRVLEDFKNLNNVLTLKVKGVNVRKFISEKGLDSLTTKYISEKTYEKPASELVVGDWATVISIDPNWEEKGYINERRNIIPNGTRGVVDAEIENLYETDEEGFNSHENFTKSFILKFPQMNYIKFDSRWNAIRILNGGTGFDNKYDTDKKATFLVTELRGIPHISSAQIELMKTQLNNTKKLLEEYGKISTINLSDIPKDDLRREVLSSFNTHYDTTTQIYSDSTNITKNDGTSVKKDSVDVKKDVTPVTKKTNKKR